MLKAYRQLSRGIQTHLECSSFSPRPQPPSGTNGSSAYGENTGTTAESLFVACLCCCTTTVFSSRRQVVPYRQCSADQQVVEGPRWDPPCTCRGPTAPETGLSRYSSNPHVPPLWTGLCWGTASCLQGSQREGTASLKVQTGNLWAADFQFSYTSSWITVHLSGEKLTYASPFWLTPRAVRETVDVLETLQFKSSEARKVFVLTKVIIPLCFLSEK